MHLDDTIAAISTPIGQGGIGIVRLSGSKALELADSIFRSPKGRRLDQAPSHTLVFGHLLNPTSGEIVDEVLVGVMRAPRTYTREDVVEINCHGGVVPLRSALTALLAAGARLAEPGEFTRRAFLNGRIDLSQAEAVMDLIRAKTDAADRLALQQLRGRLSEKINDLLNKIADLCAHVEAFIDFPEEELETVQSSEMLHSMGEIAGALCSLGATYEEGRLFREGVATVIVGKPNVGKSSLLNALLERERAIVTETPGTTRDIVEDSLNVNGLPLRVMDTAGIRESHDLAEREGVRRSLRAIEDAGLVIAVLDGSRALDGSDREVVERVAGRRSIIVINKCDIRSPHFMLQDIGFVDDATATGTAVLMIRHEASEGSCPAVGVSALTGDGINLLKRAIHDRLLPGRALCSSHGNKGDVLIANLRHREAIDRAASALSEGAAALRGGMPLEVIALSLREALDHLGVIVGVVTTDDILNRIFSEFCIGK